LSFRRIPAMSAQPIRGGDQSWNITGEDRLFMNSECLPRESHTSGYVVKPTVHLHVLIAGQSGQWRRARAGLAIAK
jgi:hypothetical protein